MAAFDFFGAAAAVLMVSPPAAGKAREIDIETVASDPGIADLRDITSKLEIAIGYAKFTQIEVVVSVDYRLALRLIESDLMNFGNLLIIQFGYPGSGHTSPPFLATTGWPLVKLDPNLSTFTFNGYGAFSYSDRLESTKIWNPKEFGGQLAYGIVSSIAKRHGLTVSNESPSPPGPGKNTLRLPDEVYKTPIPPALVDPAKWNDPITQMESDFVFMKRILRTAHCDFFLDGTSSIHFVDLNNVRAAAPVATFRLFSDVNTRVGFDALGTGGQVLPIISFESSSDWNFLAGAAVEVSKYTGPNTNKAPSQPSEKTQAGIGKDVHAGAGGAVGTAQTGGAMAAVPSARFIISEGANKIEFYASPQTLVADMAAGRAHGAVHATPPPNRDAFPDRHKWKAAVLEGQLFTAKLKTLGNPTLVPGTNIVVDGIGRFSKTYQIMGVRHTIDSSGFFTVMDLQSNGLAVLPASVPSSGVTASNTNRRPPDLEGLGAVSVAISGKGQGL